MSQCWSVYLYGRKMPVDEVEAQTLNDALRAAERAWSAPLRVERVDD